jgi:hypothetical protein
MKNVYTDENGCSVVPILKDADFVKVLKATNDEFIKEESIINGFKVTGTYPICYENLKLDRLIGKSKGETSSSQQLNISNSEEISTTLPSTFIDGDFSSNIESTNEISTSSNQYNSSEIEMNNNFSIFEDISETALGDNGVSKQYSEILTLSPTNSASDVQNYNEINHLPSTKINPDKFTLQAKSFLKSLKENAHIFDNDSKKALAFSIENLTSNLLKMINETSSEKTPYYSDILNPPPAPSRVGKPRNFKYLNYGGITDSEEIDKRLNWRLEKEGKEKKKKENQDKKMMEFINNFKANSSNNSTTILKKSRGRPKKNETPLCDLTKTTISKPTQNKRNVPEKQLKSKKKTPQQDTEPIQSTRTTRSSIKRKVD